MGFGFLLIGYIFAYIIRIGVGNYAFAGMLIGYFLIYLGLSRLCKYCPSFIYSLVAAVALIFVSFFETAEGLDAIFELGLGICGSTLADVFRWVCFGLDIVFNILMLYSIADMANRVDLPEYKGKAFRNMVFVGIYNAFQLFLLLPLSIFEGYSSFLMTLLTILALVYTLFNAVLIFKCYAFICPEGDEDMARKPSRFAFINKINAERDAKEQKAIEETRQYYADKAKKRYEKRNNNRKKKKK